MWVYTVYEWPLIISAGMTMFLAVYSLQHRSTPGAVGLAILSGTTAGWSLGYALELAGPDLAAKLVASKFQYFFITTVPVGWWIMAAQYTGRGRLIRRQLLIAILIIPVITMALAWTNEWHHLIWRELFLDYSGAFTALVLRYGPWFWVNFVYSYILLLIGSFWVLQSLARSFSYYRPQAIAMLLAIVIPWASNFAFVIGLHPVPNLDLTPISFAVSGVFFVLGIFQFRLLDLAPVARHAVVEDLLDGMIVLDWQGRVMDANPAAARILGQKQAALVGQPAERVMAAWPEVLKKVGGAGRSSVTVAARSDGLARFYDVHLSALTGDGRRNSGQLLVLRDMTEQRRLDQLRDDLAHMMVHDLRNPLSGILSSFELLEIAAAQTPDVQDTVAFGKRSAQRMLSLVVSILEVSRMENGEVELDRAGLNLADLAAEVVDSQQTLARSKKLTLTNDLATGLPTVSADARMIGRVLQNLIDNAIKFTPAGGTIAVKVGPADNGAAALQVAVQDSGPGIAEDAQSRLFEKFARGSQKGRGSGLGLAFCRLAVEAHGGRIWANTHTGQGTTIFFILPMA